jgi:hypothetical protein
MLLGSFDALPTMPILTKLPSIASLGFGFFVSGQRW